MPGSGATVPSPTCGCGPTEDLAQPSISAVACFALGRQHGDCRPQEVPIVSLRLTAAIAAVGLSTSGMVFADGAKPNDVDRFYAEL
jgi:hypothetical protein